ncbi:MAG: ATP-binding protein [Candidatus Sumerlaeota bacterium]|nr:ATP-binding protein [Candidatus Sumerlaeota bacterium]
MLIKFVVENFLSFKNETILDMAAASAEKAHPKHIIEMADGKRVSLLRTAAIYGANAAGKSNLIKAMAFAQKLIVDGAKRDKEINVQPFMLCKEMKSKPSRFEFLIKVDGVIYHYGFVLDIKRIHEEWLYGTEKTKEAMMFERSTDKHLETSAEIGGLMEGQSRKRRQLLKYIAQSTRHDKLCLSEFAEKNQREIASLLPVIQWFQNTLTIVEPDSHYGAFAARSFKDRKFLELSSALLHIAGTDIESLRIKKEKLIAWKNWSRVPQGVQTAISSAIDRAKNKSAEESHILVETKDSFMNILIDEHGEAWALTLYAIHKNSDRQDTPLAMEDESDGTRRLLDFASILAGRKNDARVIVIDELDHSLHPMMTKLFMEVFFRSLGPDSQRQIIFSTHETHLLDLDLLRRDEIWFMEKDESQSSRLYSLVEFKPRLDLKIDKGYLQGRFGAIPFIGDPEKLNLR